MTDQRKEEQAGPASERRRIQVLIRDEDLDDVKAQARTGIGRLLPEDLDVVEGQIYILRVPKPGDQADDTEGLGRTGYGGMGQTEEDVEGQGGRINGLEPASPEDVEGQGKYRWLREIDEGWSLETDDDTEGHGRGGFNG